MRNWIVVGLVMLFTGSVATAQMKVQPQSGSAAKSPVVINQQKGTFPRISQADAYMLFRQGKAVFIDVRSNTQFQKGHIKDSLSIPGSQIIQRFKEVPVGKTVIAYCACSAEQSSGTAASNLIAHGVKNVFALKGGWNDWKTNGYPSATGPK